MRRTLVAAVAACALTLAGCGGGTVNHTPRRALAPVAAPAQCVPTPGQGHMGVCSAAGSGNLLLTSTSRSITAPHGLLYDLYEGDFRNCAAPLQDARGELVGVIVKAYEYRPDNCFATYWRELARLHIWHAAYVFAHGCWQAQPFVTTVKAAGGWDQYAGPNIVDAEVADAFGSLTCLSPQIRALSHVATVVGYTAPGTWPGGGDGGDPLWVATYGLNFGCVWTCHPVAWQYTDGILGPFPHSVGPFHGDLSVNYGLAQILAHPTPPPPPPVCYTHHESAAQCIMARKRVAALRAELHGVQWQQWWVGNYQRTYHCRPNPPYRLAGCRRAAGQTATLAFNAAWLRHQISVTIADN